MRILITGASGFVGDHLVRNLRQNMPDAELHGTSLPDTPTPAVAESNIHELDLRETQRVDELIAGICPERIYHLAAQASVARSFADPWETLENNILAQLNIIEACLRADIQPRMLVISSAEIYGQVSENELPIREDAPLRPNSPYGVSKVAQDMLALQYVLSHKLPIMRVRAFNHFGPGQSEQFVATDWGMQIARIEAGSQRPVLLVGNLSAQRDFTDVRDVVDAYRLIVEHSTPGEVYNVASGTARSIRSLLEGLLKLAEVKIEVSRDPDRLRPASIPILVGDSTRLREATGWKPRIPFEQSLSDILDDCRQRVQQQGAIP